MNEATRGYRDLIAWQKAMDLIPMVYELVKRLPSEERFALGDQIRRAVVSVAANIAEGQARHSAKEFAQHLSIARGSLAEVDTLLLVGKRLKYWTTPTEIHHQLLEVRRLLQSEGELTIASTGKDPQTGRHVTHEYRVEGPVMLFLTTTAVEVDEELLNRCLVLTVDEGREQTRAIHTLQRQRQTIEGLLEQQDRGKLLELHQNAQRLLRPLLVANPFATELEFVDHRTRTRRDHMKYLTLIRSIALLYQHQRRIKTVQHRGSEVRYIEVSKSDVELADRLCAQMLLRSVQELAPQARKVLGGIGELVQQRSRAQGLERSEVCFTQRELREHTGLSATALKVQLRRLVELEYVSVHGHREHRQRLWYGLMQDYDEDRSETGPGCESPVLSKGDRRLAQPVRAQERIVTANGVNGASYHPPKTKNHQPPSAH